jgi:serine/threonine protein kinase
MHKDLKGQNILLSSHNVIKLSDFGCAMCLEKSLSSSEQRCGVELLEGSVLWMAPEVVLQTKQGRKSDIWSLGCTVIEMLTATLPWQEQAFDNPMQAILHIARDGTTPKVPTGISQELNNFITACLNRDYNMRPTAQILMQHNFFKLKTFS